MRKILFFAILCLSFTKCSAQGSSFLISDNHFNQDLLDSCNIFKDVINKGFAAIPELIELIDLKQKSRVGFHEPSSSSFYEFSQNNYKGIKAAYLIEFLLGSDIINDKLVEVDQTTKIFNIYGYCIIVRKEDKSLIKKPLTFDDMKEIKEIYKKWWKENKNKDWKQLRKDWKEMGSVLIGSDYSWI